MDEPYSKRELDTAFQGIADHLKKQDFTLERIENQTTKTNGRVGRLELWRTIMVSVFTAIVIVIVFLIPHLISLLSDEVTYAAGNASSKAVQQQFKSISRAYNIQVDNSP